MTAAKQPVRDVWGANQYQDIVERALEWAVPFMVQSVQALKRDGRPLGTAKVGKYDRLTRLLEAGPEFWDALKANDPEAAAKLAADILKARADGIVPEQGPRVGEAQQIEDQQAAAAQGQEPTGTQVAHPVAPAIVRGVQDSVA